MINVYKQKYNLNNKDTIKIEGFVEIKNGDIHIKAKNKFVQTMLRHITNILSCGKYAAGTGQNITLPCYSYNIFIGSDISTPTLYNTTALTLPIGTSPGTPANILQGATSNPSNGVFILTITGTWNPGTVTGIVGEMALSLDTTDATLQTFGWTVSLSPTGDRLASRLSVADGDFSTFSISTTNPLVITWTIRFSFT